MLCDRMGIDIWEVIDAAATKPFGFMRFDPGPGHGRPLPPGRPVLPRLQGARARLPDRVHRARRQGQPGAAALLRRAGRARAERRRQAGQGLADPPARRLLQGRRRRHARVAGAEDRPRCCATSAPRSPTTTRTSPEVAELGLRSRRARRRRSAAATSPASSPRTTRSTTSASSRDAPLVLDFRGVTRGIEAANLVRL